MPTSSQVTPKDQAAASAMIDTALAVGIGEETVAEAVAAVQWRRFAQRVAAENAAGRVIDLDKLAGGMLPVLPVLPVKRGKRA